jgi:phosphoserine phosphatase
MRSLCAEHATDLSESYYYGDSVADLPVLEAVGHPVVVNPRDRLRAIAGERGWRCSFSAGLYNLFDNGINAVTIAASA